LFTNTDPNATGGATELILTGASTYGGDTYITSQTAPTNSFKTFYVRVQGNNRLPPTTKLYLGGTSSAFTADAAGANGTLILDGNQTLAGLYAGTSAGTDSRVEGGKSSTSMLTLDIASGTTNSVGGLIGSDRTNGNKIQLVKTGLGQLTLTTTNTYADGTIVSSGTLAVDGKIDGLVTVDAGATLMGSGTIGGAATVNGMLKPGNSPGTLTFDNTLNLGTASTTTVRIASTSSHDVLANDGGDTITFNSGSTIVFDTTGYTAQNGDSFTVLTNWSGRSGTIIYKGKDLGNGLMLDTTKLLSDGIVTVGPFKRMGLFILN
jgi:autotransporter-associated beta strand protein